MTDVGRFLFRCGYCIVVAEWLCLIFSYFVCTSRTFSLCLVLVGFSSIGIPDLIGLWHVALFSCILNFLTSFDLGWAIVSS
jgi:hypothetical protein